jgi:N-carbamoylputrescine amidase
MVTVGLIQMHCQEAPGRNLARAQTLVRQAARRGAQVICLPELYRSRYFCQTEDFAAFKLAEPVPGPSTRAFARLARQLGVVLVVPVFERRAPGLYHNSAVVIDADGKLAGQYRKMHIPDDPLYYEKFYFTPGDLGFRSFATRHGQIGVLICWDQWYPEAARLTALTGAQILFLPTAIGWHQHEKATLGQKQFEAWVTAQRAHAIANGLFVAAPNRCGTENTIEFWGGSFVAGPFGELLAQAGQEEELVLAQCDFDQIDDQRIHWPFLRDRRIDAFGGLTQRWLA